MSGDREARALGAGDSIEVNGVKYTLRPVGIGYLSDLEREALRAYKRQYLETFSENADLLPDGRAASLVEEKMMEISRWTLEDLPKKTAYDVSKVPITKTLKRWVQKHYAGTADEETSIRAVIVTALDSGQLTSAEVRKMAGRAPLQGNVRFDQWWVTASMDGMAAFILNSVKQEHPEVSTEQIQNWPLPKVIEASRMAEVLTSASMGNG